MSIIRTNDRRKSGLQTPWVPSSTADLKQQQQAAESEVDRFRLALGPFVVAAERTRMAMIFTNATGPGEPIIFANDSFLALTDFAGDEVVGQPFDFVMAGTADPRSVARIAAQFNKMDSETTEVDCRRRDGRPFPVAVRINPVLDWAGAVVQHCVSFVDLSGHREGLRNEREALHALFQHTPDFITMLEGPDHRFTFANDAYQRLVGHRDLLGKTIAEVLPEVVAQGFVALLDQVYRTGKPFNGDGVAVELVRKGAAPREVRYVDFVYQAIRGPDAAITGVFCEGHDVTEQKRAVENVQRLQAELVHLARVSAMGTMAATLAHELAQPLTVISNYAALCRALIDAPGSDANAMKDGLDALADSALRAGEIIRGLKHMTKGGKPVRELFDLRDAVADTIGLMRAGACKGVSIVDGIASGMAINADRVQIQQVIMNLVKNACEAMTRRRAGRITISATAKQNRVTVSVDDDGPGIQSDVVATLFEWSDSKKVEGMGIGLSICRTIVTAHGGEIWLDRSDSKGARFCFSLPIRGARRRSGINGTGPSGRDARRPH